MNYAQLDLNNMCVGVSRLSNAVIQGNMIEISTYDDTLLNRVHKSGEEFYPLLAITVDKAQITANGTDTATITVTVQDAVNPHTISFTVNNGSPVIVNTANGVATLPITTTVAGDYIVTATSDIYGTNSVTIKGV